MKLKYPTSERQRVLGLCLHENEHQFFIAVRMEDGMLIYDSLPILAEGTKHSGTTDTYSEAAKRKDEFKGAGLFLIMGHTHPVPEGKNIPSAYAGWTIERTRELRDYRDGRLLEMKGSKDYIERRGALLKEHNKLDWHSPKRKSIREELFEKSLEFGDANLIERNGLLFYISNMIGGPRVLEDINEHCGDTSAFLGMRSLFNMWEVPHLDYAVIAKPRKEAVWTPSSPDKFEIVAMRHTPEAFGGFEKIEIVDK